MRKYMANSPAGKSGEPKSDNESDIRMEHALFIDMERRIMDKQLHMYPSVSLKEVGARRGLWPTPRSGTTACLQIYRLAVQGLYDPPEGGAIHQPDEGASRVDY